MSYMWFFYTISVAHELYADRCTISVVLLHHVWLMSYMWFFCTIGVAHELYADLCTISVTLLYH
jgi:hypothetical protein